MLIARKGQVITARGRKEAGAMHFLRGAANDLDEIGIPAGAKQTFVEGLVGSKSSAVVVCLNSCGMQSLNAPQFVQQGRRNRKGNLFGGERLERLADGINLAHGLEVEEPDSGALVKNALNETHPFELR